MRKIRFFLLLISVVIISSFVTYFLYDSFIIENTYTLDIKLKVDDHFGLNVDSDSINFGRLMPGTSAERSILVNNNASYPLRVVILKSGYIADWVEVSENNFILEANESRQVNFTAYAQKEINFGNYTGKVKIIFKKILFR